MRSTIALGVIFAMVLGSSAAWTGASADDNRSWASGSSEQETAKTPPEPSKDVFESGAASMEPSHDGGKKAVDKKEVDKKAAQDWSDLTSDCNPNYR
jgi:hypothetical protein